jgi:tetratricopeptide (TPR) repeat protein
MAAGHLAGGHERAGVVEVLEPGSADRNEELDERVATMKREIDALQIQMAEKTKPWWKQLSVLLPLLVSFGALSFSIWTDQKSDDRIERQQEHETRVELRELIQRLQALPKENFDLAQNYPNNPDLRVQINTENLVLSRQAAGIIEELDGNVSATEYLAVSAALVFSSMHAEASELLTQGIAAAQDAAGELYLLRQDALVRFALGDLDGGRSRWAEALDIYEKYPEEIAISVAANSMYTEMSWASAELGQDECPAALRHITAAKERIAELVPQHPWAGWIGQVNATEIAINNKCP